MNTTLQQAEADAWLRRLRVVLVGTVHSGNIGSVARAMKTMGLRELVLAAPQDFPSREARYMAVSAVDLVDEARVVDGLPEAVADCQLVVGTSARMRRIPVPVKTPADGAAELLARHRKARVALVFGREDSGLNNEELRLCHWHLQIPSSPDYPSLNLAAAAQVVCYELRMAALRAAGHESLQPPSWDEPLATVEGMERFYAHLEETLTEIGFLDPKAPRQLMTRLRRLYNRVHLDQMELNILRGMLTETQKAARRDRDNT